MNFHSMTSSCIFKRGTNFSQAVTDKALFATFPKMRTFFGFNQARNYGGAEGRSLPKIFFPPLGKMCWT